MAKAGKTTQVLIWILMGMLVLGLGGFGVTNLSGNLRTIGTVGEKDIDINQYARALQSDIRAIEAQTGQSLNFAQIQEFGVDAAALNRIVSSRALDNETAELGLSIGDDNLSRQILEISAFQGIDGKFDREGYKFALSQQGLTETQFEDSLREETVRSLLQGAIVSGTAMPDAYSDTLMNYIGEQRDFSWARLGKTDLPMPLPTPTPDQIKTYHQSHLPDFTLPEMKRLTYVWLTPDMLVDAVEIDQEALEQLYEDRKQEFVQPERRLVERLVFSDEAAAEVAKIALEGAETTFETLVEERGLALSDIDLGDVAKSELGAAGGAVFGGDVATIVGPFSTSVGPALFRINGILPAQEVSFEDAKPTLREELALERARRVIDSEIETVEDLLAGGATLEELATETAMELATLDWHPENDKAAAAYSAFTEAAKTVTGDDFAEVIQLEDGGIVALRLDEIIEPKIQPVEDVSEAVKEAWLGAQIDRMLAAKAADILQKIQDGNDMATLDLTVTQESDITRSDYIIGTPPAFLEDVFTMDVGETKTIDSFGSVLIVQLNAINAPDSDDEDLAVLRQRIQDQAVAAISQDLFTAFAQDIRQRAGVSLDQNAINAVHANFQ